MRITEKDIRRIIRQELQNMKLNERGNPVHTTTAISSLQNAVRQLNNAIGSEIRGEKMRKAQQLKDRLEQLSDEISSLG